MIKFHGYSGPKACEIFLHPEPKQSKACLLCNNENKPEGTLEWSRTRVVRGKPPEPVDTAP